MTARGSGSIVHKGLFAVVIALLASGCADNTSTVSEHPPTTTTTAKKATGTTTTTATTTTSSTRPVADPPEAFADGGMPVGPDDVHVGYQAAFALVNDTADTVIATDLATGDEVWQWSADADARYGMSSDEPLPVLALSRENDTERLQFTGVRRTEGSGTQRATAVLRTTVLDAVTGAELGKGEAPLPPEFAEAGLGAPSVDATSVGVRGRYAVSTVHVSGSLPMTLITDLTTGSASWAGPGFLATGLGATTAVGAVNDDPMAGNDTLQAIALDTRRPVWTGGTVRDGTVMTPAPTLVTATMLEDDLTFATHVYNSADGRELAVIDDVTDCEFDQRDVVVCSGMRSTMGMDATTAQRLWRLPDDAAGRVDPGLDAAFHGRVYAHDVILDARTGKDAVPSLSVTADDVVPGYAITRFGGEAVAYPATA